MVLAISSIVYLILIIFLVSKINKIKKRQGIYNENLILERVEKYLERNQNFDINRSSKIRLLIIAVVRVMTVFGFLVGIYLLFIYLTIPKGFKLLSTNSSSIIFITIFFLTLSSIGLVVYPSNPRYKLGSLVIEHKNKLKINKFEYEKRYRDQYLLHIIALIIFIIVFPFYTFGLTNFGYYNESKLVYRGYFEFSNKTINYNEIKSVKREFLYNINDEVFGVSYKIYLDDGYSLDILFPSEFDQTLEIHQYLKNSRPELFSPYDISSKENDFITKKNKNVEEILYKIFD